MDKELELVLLEEDEWFPVLSVCTREDLGDPTFERLFQPPRGTYFPVEVSKETIGRWKRAHAEFKAVQLEMQHQVTEYRRSHNPDSMLEDTI